LSAAFTIPMPVVNRYVLVRKVVHRRRRVIVVVWSSPVDRTNRGHLDAFSRYFYLGAGNE